MLLAVSHKVSNCQDLTKEHLLLQCVVNGRAAWVLTSSTGLSALPHPGCWILASGLFRGGYKTAAAAPAMVPVTAVSAAITQSFRNS